MPTYDYRCPSCGHTVEMFHGMSESPPVPCPECGAECEKVISGGAGLIFKGNGFYKTDYGTGAPPAACGRSSRCCGRSAPCDNPPCAN